VALLTHRAGVCCRYVFIGVLVQSEHDNFRDFNKCARTLFALVNGDSILDLYKEVCDESFSWGSCIFGQVYLYTFCMLFIAIVLNVFIIIIENG